ncbi:hypothetical protein [Nonomuraea rhizosphaerae]|uniref:hypothetical protein n=1 Tax=Nonomuraea rhizosphaerae TaxID=2665663 RepID=UPI001C60140A|nr:hypothetical protein [Nonomuraea rhizosphaerae]
MSTFLNVIAVLSGTLSAITALAAVYLAVRAEKRSRKVAAAQIYLALRARFLEIFERLGDVDGAEPASEDERAARAAYWHHSFDEWYLSTRFAPSEFRGLWDGFYRDATHSGLAHPALRQALIELRDNRTAGFGVYARDFVTEMLGSPEPSSAAKQEGVPK